MPPPMRAMRASAWISSCSRRTSCRGSRTTAWMRSIADARSRAIMPPRGSGFPGAGRHAGRMPAMTALTNLLEKNREWSARIRRNDPEFFARLSRQQRPKYLWIGCSDSRVPANEIVGLLPGELFVHRNVANVVVHSDLNCLSVMQFAVQVLQVEHIIVVGHYGCGGVGVALRDERLGLADNWLRHVQDVYAKHGSRVEAIADEPGRIDRLCELNVIEQVAN